MSGTTELTDTDRAEARHILYGLDAILRLHVAQEEELFSALSPGPDAAPDEPARSSTRR
jgi:hypothetical protein